MKWIEKIKTKMPVIILAVLLIVIILVIAGCIRLQNKLEELGNQLMYLQDTNSILNEEVLNLQTNIESALEEEASLLEKYQVEVLGMNLQKGTYEVKVSVVPKEYSDSTRTSVFFGVNEFPLILNRYTFEGTMELSFADVYDGNITFLFSNGDKKNTEIAKNYVGIQTKLQELLYGSIETIPTYRNGKIVFDHSVEYSLNEYDGNPYESLELVLVADEKEVKVVDLLTEDVIIDESVLYEEETEEPTITEHSVENETNENEVQNALEEVSNSTDSNQTGDLDTPNSDIEDNDVVTEKKEQPLGKSGMIEFKKSISMKDGTKVRLFLRAKNKLGFTLEYDLFSAITSKTGPNGYEETEDYFPSEYKIYDKDRNVLEL